ncbi:hypothetical protein ACOSQ3_013237 [Xanthoceras sorbifolium]
MEHRWFAGIYVQGQPITELQARGRFARLCVEIDISQPLRITLKVDGRYVRVEYESLGLICFNCGRVGHGKDSCRKGTQEHHEATRRQSGSTEERVVVNQKAEASQVSSTPKEFGPWMVVTYNKNGRRHWGNNHIRIKADGGKDVGTENTNSGTGANKRKYAKGGLVRAGKELGM